MCVCVCVCVCVRFLPCPAAAWISPLLCARCLALTLVNLYFQRQRLTFTRRHTEANLVLIGRRSSLSCTYFLPPTISACLEEARAAEEAEDVNHLRQQIRPQVTEDKST